VATAAPPEPAPANGAESHYSAPETLPTDLPPTRVPIPETTYYAPPPPPVAPTPVLPEAAESVAVPSVANETEGDHQVAEAPAEAAPVAAGGAGALILLIEDDERIAKFYSILFEAKGYEVQNARDGVEGVDMATSLNPALILLDVMMPKMNGLMVLQTLRANPETEHTPVVVLSNYMEPPLIQRALQLGAIEYVVKSQARPEQLVNAVPSWLQGEPALH
jgi:CheY-like chemotaxis protein